MTFFELQKLFPNEEAVINHFISIKFKNGASCHKCGSLDVYHRKDTPKRFQCRNCKNSISIFTNTIFEGTSTCLVKWMYAIHLLLNGKKGISGLQLQREIGGGYKTCWRMLKQIRLAMSTNKEDFKNNFKFIVEMDETYVGGKPRKGNNKYSKEKPQRGRGTKKIPVIGVIDRVNKRVFAKVALPNKEGKKLSGKQLLSVFKEVVKEEEVIIMTDEFRSYRIFDKTKHIHFTIDHSKAYSNGLIHVNNMESFWATLKRGIYGIYHHISLKYLQTYVDEFCFRYNNRKNPDIFDILLERAILR